MACARRDSRSDYALAAQPEHARSDHAADDFSFSGTGAAREWLLWVISGLLLMHGRGPLYPNTGQIRGFRIISLRAINTCR